MKKNKFVLALISITLLLTCMVEVQTSTEPVIAATQGYVKVKAKKKSGFIGHQVSILIIMLCLSIVIRIVPKAE